MIKYSLYQQKTKTPTSFSHQAQATQEGAELLATEKSRQHLLSTLKTHIQAPPEHFAALYTQLLQNVAEFVQHIPLLEDPTTLWLDHQLERTEAALKALHQQLAALPGHQMTSAYKAQLTYAVFSAALLIDLDKIITHYAINLCTAQGEFTAEWQPLVETLLKAGQYYQYKPKPNATEKQLHPITVLIAYKLMPTDGLVWLASHSQLFQQWLSMLLGEEGTGSLIEAIFSLFKTVRVVHKEIHEPINVTPATTHTDPQNIIPPDAHQQDVGETFIKWVKEGLENKTLALNTPDAMIHIVNKGGLVLLHPQLFQLYFTICSRTQPNFPSWTQIFQQFCQRMGLSAKSAHAAEMVRFANSKQEALRVNAAQFFPDGKIPGVNPAIKLEAKTKEVNPNYPILNYVAENNQKKSSFKHHRDK